MSKQLSADILEKHCPSMSLLYLDEGGVAFRGRILAAMSEYTNTQLVEAQERIKTLEAVLSEIANYNNNFSDFGNWLGCRQLARKAILPDNTIKKED